MLEFFFPIILWWFCLLIAVAQVGGAEDVVHLYGTKLKKIAYVGRALHSLYVVLTLPAYGLHWLFKPRS